MNFPAWRDRAVISFAWLFILTFAGFTFYRQGAPKPLAASASPESFSAERAAQYVGVIAANPHPTGTAEHAKVGAYIAAQLEACGFTVAAQSTPALRRDRNSIQAATIHNIIGRLSGLNNSGVIVLVAHYDTVPVSPGGMDNSAAVAALLETARALKAGAALQNDVVVLFTDGEESAGLGAKAFVEEHPWAKEIALVLNFDARGNKGPFIMFETSKTDRSLIRGFAKATPHPVSNSLTSEIYRRMPNRTDFTLFKNAGIPGFNFACIDGYESYHNLTDTGAHVSKASLQHEGDCVLSLTRHFGQVHFGKSKNEDMTYFDVLGFGIIAYPGAWGTWLAVFVSLGWIGLLVFSIRKKAAAIKPVLIWTAGILILSVFCFALGWGVNRFLLGFNGERLLFFKARLIIGGLVFVAFSLVTMVFAIASRRNEVMSFVFGVFTNWLAFLWFSTGWFSGAGFLFVWPLLAGLCGLPLLFAGKKAAVWKKLLLLALFTVPGMVVMVPSAVHGVVAMGLPLAGGIMVFAVLTGSCLLVPFSVMTDSRGKTWPGVSALCGLTLVMIGLFGITYSPERPRLDTVFYLLDSDEDRAVWGSPDRSVDPWTAQIFGPNPQRSSLAKYIPWDRAPHFTNGAPMYSVEPPQVAVLEDRKENGFRHLRLRVLSKRNAPLISIFTETPIVAVQLEQKSVEGSGTTTLFPKGLVLRYEGLPSEGLELSLTMEDRELNLQVLDQTYGLPSELGLPKRPAWIVPGLRSDVLFVRRSFKL